MCAFLVMEVCVHQFTYVLVRMEMCVYARAHVHACMHACMFVCVSACLLLIE